MFLGCIYLFVNGEIGMSWEKRIIKKVGNLSDRKIKGFGGVLVGNVRIRKSMLMLDWK